MQQLVVYKVRGFSHF